MRSYNTALHSGIGVTPLERYQQTRTSIQMPKSREWLEECFLNRITRTVSSAFILYEGERYPIRLTDKNENCRTKRRSAPDIDYSKLGGGR